MMYKVTYLTNLFLKMVFLLRHQLWVTTGQTQKKLT